MVEVFHVIFRSKLLVIVSKPNEKEVELDPGYSALHVDNSRSTGNIR